MIIRLYETFEDEKNIYLVQEYNVFYKVIVKEENFLVGYKKMVISVKMMQGNYLHKLSNVLSIYILKKSRIEISNLRTSSWVPQKRLRWKLSILDCLINGEIQWEKS